MMKVTIKKYKCTYGKCDSEIYESELKFDSPGLYHYENQYGKRHYVKEIAPEIYRFTKSQVKALCKAIFVLNRYAKNGADYEEKEDIYTAKNMLIKILYQHSFCEKVVSHYQNILEKRCWCTDEYPGGASDCHRCGGTGVYQEAHQLELLCFKFVVGADAYSWHQIKSDVDYPVQVSDDNSIQFESIPKDFKYADVKKAFRYVRKQRKALYWLSK